ncbi:5'-3' exoribonuclease 1 [Holothuria leucospilota]|uniref:5'-3' exoribonuclease 1 n=1 Tax=Holothuria leucospilota TaxID=206669 RepID=A0A9Q0YFE0_HOLLE|nr:5'-3' exoribonuclease 1 [Holothuria leucospilota]
MGVPKFYRWISERYPCLSEVVKENQIPEFDNLYLDMNGIIHTCSHPNDEDVHFRIPEEKMFKDIFHYIEVLFRIIRPRKVFFMAVDGVAPRAKMNQQRGRRFRSAKEAENREKEAIAKGEVLPKEKRFDSNCITPGTEFMVRLQKQLAYFVHQKVTHDRLWQGIRVYLSGHEVKKMTTPGEGEHKVMDFIRSEKSRNDYDPNTRHCLYGLDADLLMLGLVSHEPHFSLLREEVRFGKQSQQQRPTTPEETTFHLLHLSLLREYLAEEFKELKTLPWFDIESIIDDWVMMGFLVGNDFIPNLPNMHINHGALPDLYKIYIKLLPSLNGYINNNGVLHLKRFEAFLKALSKHEEDVFQVQNEEFDFLVSKKSKEAWKSQRVQKKIEEKERRMRRAEQSTIMQSAAKYYESLRNEEVDEDDESVDSLAEELKSCGLQIMEFSDASDDENNTSALELKMKKREYYRAKLEKINVSDEEVTLMGLEYVRAIQWILHYYYNGCQSWSWYYPYHYAPYVSDITDFSNVRFEYEMSKPFLPFQQLLAVLPAASKDLLPAAYRPLMVREDSPIIDFYPQEFEEDLNGKQQAWEAVVKIPFIDEKRLLEAMSARDSSLKESEIQRNTHSEHLLITYDEKSSFLLKSSLPGHFPDISHCKAKCVKIPLDAFWLPRVKVKKGLCKGVKLGVYYPGFPTLHHLKFQSELRKEDVKVFQQNSRGDNMILKIQDQNKVKQAEEVCQNLLGKIIFAEWPHMKEVRVVAVSDCSKRFELVQSKGVDQQNMTDKLSMRCCYLSDKEVEIFNNSDVAGIASQYHKRKGVLIGDTSVIVHACPLLGRKYICGNGGVISLEKQWAPTPNPYAYQMTVKDIAVHDSSFKQFKTLSEVFPKDTECFMLGNPHYGAMGKVLDATDGKVTVRFNIPTDPDFQFIMKREQQHRIQYYPAHVLAKKLAVSSHLVSRITGTIFISKGPPPSTGVDQDIKSGSRINVGLNLKFNKTSEEVPGYTKKFEEGTSWQYSNKLLDVLREYVVSFPEIFDMLSGTKSQSDVFYETDVFGDSPTRLKELRDWLSEVECCKTPRAKSGQQVLDEPIIKLIQDEVAKAAGDKPKKVKLLVRPHLLHRPFDYQGNLIPDPLAMYQLYDRVINVREGYSVPLGLRGVIVGIQEGATILDTIYDVVFDEEFVGGLKLRCNGHCGYRMTAAALMNISFGARKEPRNDKPLAVVKPQPNEIRFFNPTSSAPHTQQQQWYVNKINQLGSTDRNQGREGSPQQRPSRTSSQTMEGVHNQRSSRTGSQQGSQPRQVRNQTVEAQNIPRPPSFASIVKPGGPPSKNQNQAALDQEKEAKAGMPKYTILSRWSEESGKSRAVLKKREKMVRRGNSDSSRTNGPSDESSTNSSEVVESSPEQSVCSPPPQDQPIHDVNQADQNKSGDLNDVWQKLTTGEGEDVIRPPGEMHAGSGRKGTPTSVDVARSSTSSPIELNSSEPLSPQEIWDETSDSAQDEQVVRIEEKGEEKVTSDSYAKKETEQLCQLLNLSHITAGGPDPGTKPAPPPIGQAQTDVSQGMKISLEELLQVPLSPRTTTGSRGVPVNPPPGFAPMGHPTSKLVPPSTSSQLFPFAGNPQSLFSAPGGLPVRSIPGNTLPPSSHAQMARFQNRYPVQRPPPPGPSALSAHGQGNQTQRSAFQPVPQQTMNQGVRVPPQGFFPPQQYQPLSQGIMPLMQNVPMIPGVAPGQGMGTHGPRVPPMGMNSMSMGAPRMALPQQQAFHGLPQQQQKQQHPGPNMVQGQTTRPPVRNTNLPLNTHGVPQYPQPIGQQFQHSPGRPLPNPTHQNLPVTPERQRSPPGQPGFPAVTQGSTPTSSSHSGATESNNVFTMETMLNKLRAFCDSKGLRHPQYEYVETDIIGEFFVLIYLPTGHIIRGERCSGRRNALELAAFKALQHMRSNPDLSSDNQGQILSTKSSAQFVPLQVSNS